MPIHPLPVFEADADPRHRSAMSDTEVYERLEPPKAIVVRFGYMKQVGEFPYDGDAKPGCGTKLVARTPRGTEIVDMLTVTCDNAGCSKSVTRQEMLEYIENSGGREFPFSTDGKILHVASIEELNKQGSLDSLKSRYVARCKAMIGELNLPMKLVEVEPILGEELLTFYFMAQERVDFRTLVRKLAGEFKTRIEMRQVGARDEARLVADYERCGQHCCCKNFLKVLKPVSMKSAKIQKATLDPLKISGRCGRLMCCLRYEDQTYAELRRKLPHRGTRVGTSEGVGTVVDSKILVQLVLVRLEDDQREIAVPVEELMPPDEAPTAAEREKLKRQEERLLEERERLDDPLRGMAAEKVALRTRDDTRGRKKSRRRRGRTKAEQQDAFRQRAESESTLGEGEGKEPAKGEEPKPAEGGAPTPKRRRRRRRRRGGGTDGAS